MSETIIDYVKYNYQPEDRVAVVMLRHGTDETRYPSAQRIVEARAVISPRWQEQLDRQNQAGFDIYISPNTFGSAENRRKENVAEIRHVYLDLDHEAQDSLIAMRKDERIPSPNHLIETSPGRYQLIWRVDGFTPPQAEELMRGMAREFGADPAATDATRVMRWPGFVAHKHEPPGRVMMRTLTNDTYVRAAFPVYAHQQEAVGGPERSVLYTPRKRAEGASVSQSEVDWAETKQALRRGVSPNALVQELITHRQDKANPSYYAERTVKNAQEELAREPKYRQRQSYSQGM